jgi:hypothetical protein
MPQGPIAVAGANLIPQGAKSNKNITAATVIKATPGTLIAFAIIVAGSGDGTVNDCATTGAAATANELAVISHTAGIGIYQMNAPCNTAICITPGTGQTIAAWYI